jgi:hypothetical protein
MGDGIPPNACQQIGTPRGTMVKFIGPFRYITKGLSSSRIVIALCPRARRAAALGCVAAGGPYPAPGERLAQQHLDLGVHAAQLGIRQSLDRIVKRRIETQGKGFLGTHHMIVSRATLR